MDPVRLTLDRGETGEALMSAPKLARAEKVVVLSRMSHHLPR